MERQHQTTIYMGLLGAWSLLPTFIISSKNGFHLMFGWLKWGIDIQIERL